MDDIPAVEEPSTAAPIATPPGRFLPDLGANLLAGLRLAFFVRKGISQLRPAPEQLIVLAILDVLLNLVGSFIANGAHGMFNVWALPRILLYLPFLLLGAYLVARRESRLSLFVCIPIALMAAVIPVEIVSRCVFVVLSSGAVEAGPHASQALYYAIVAWWVAIMGCTTFWISNSGTAFRLGNSFIVALLVVVPTVVIPSQGDLWIRADPGAGAAANQNYFAVVREDNFYAQPEILSRKLAALLPGRAGVADLYFVGFAGYAAEDVFMKETEVITQLFRERFDTEGRMVALVNNPQTLDRYPIATRTSLARTLDRIGGLIDREEDVVFLYLTSHGSETQFSVQFWPLQLNDLDGATLKSMLDSAGIKWRVIVVSACYSGSFIEPLKDDNTLVVTAADATHTSFGCGSESDFTYFGKAYFDQELRRTYSFTEAYDKARVSIEQREQSEHKTASHPQIYAGAAIKQKLVELESRFAAAAPAVPPPAESVTVPDRP